MDNISLNDVCVNEILHKLCLDLNKIERRLKYISLIINLAIQAFLFGQDPEIFGVKAIVVRDTRLAT